MAPTDARHDSFAQWRRMRRAGAAATTASSAADTPPRRQRPHQQQQQYADPLQHAAAQYDRRGARQATPARPPRSAIRTDTLMQDWATYDSSSKKQRPQFPQPQPQSRRDKPRGSYESGHPDVDVARPFAEQASPSRRENDGGRERMDPYSVQHERLQRMQDRYEQLHLHREDANDVGTVTGDDLHLNAVSNQEEEEEEEEERYWNAHERRHADAFPSAPSSAYVRDHDHDHNRDGRWGFALGNHKQREPQASLRHRSSTTTTESTTASNSATMNPRAVLQEFEQNLWRIMHDDRSETSSHGRPSLPHEGSSLEKDNEGIDNDKDDDDDDDDDLYLHQDYRHRRRRNEGDPPSSSRSTSFLQQATDVISATIATISSSAATATTTSESRAPCNVLFKEEISRSRSNSDVSVDHDPTAEASAMDPHGDPYVSQRFPTSEELERNAAPTVAFSSDYESIPEISLTPPRTPTPGGLSAKATSATRRRTADRRDRSHADGRRGGVAGLPSPRSGHASEREDDCDEANGGLSAWGWSLAVGCVVVGLGGFFIDELLDLSGVAHQTGAVPLKTIEQSEMHQRLDELQRELLQFRVATAQIESQSQQMVDEVRGHLSKMHAERARQQDMIATEMETLRQYVQRVTDELIEQEKGEIRRRLMETIASSIQERTERVAHSEELEEGRAQEERRSTEQVASTDDMGFVATMNKPVVDTQEVEQPAHAVADEHRDGWEPEVVAVEVEVEAVQPVDVKPVVTEVEVLPDDNHQATMVKLTEILSTHDLHLPSDGRRGVPAPVARVDPSSGSLAAVMPLELLLLLAAISVLAGFVGLRVRTMNRRRQWYAQRRQRLVRLRLQREQQASAVDLDDDTDVEVVAMMSDRGARTETETEGEEEEEFSEEEDGRDSEYYEGEESEEEEEAKMTEVEREVREEEEADGEEEEVEEEEEEEETRHGEEGDEEEGREEEQIDWSSDDAVYERFAEERRERQKAANRRLYGNGGANGSRYAFESPRHEVSASLPSRSMADASASISRSTANGHAYKASPYGQQLRRVADEAKDVRRSPRLYPRTKSSVSYMR